MAKKNNLYMVKSIYIYRFEHIFNSKTCIKDKQSSLKHQSLLLPHYITSVPIYYMYHTGYCFPPRNQICWSLSMGHHTLGK